MPKSQECNDFSQPLPWFPLFVCLENVPVLIAGGGNVAARRAEVLLRYGAHVTVVAPEISHVLKTVLNETGAGSLTFLCRAYASADLDGMKLAIAATNSPEVNRIVTADCRAKGIPVCAADLAGSGDFLFPAVFSAGGVTGGLVSLDIQDHTTVKTRAEEIRGLLNRTE